MTNHDNGSCSEYRNLTRRTFLKGTGAVAAGIGATAALPGVASAFGAGTQRDVLVHVFFRGGLDGLSFCVPHGDRELYAARPNLAIGTPGSTGGAIDLDGFFGLNPAAGALMTPFDAGHLAIVQATGSPDPTRSHFDAMKAMERALPQQPLDSLSSGWIARHLNVTPPVASGGSSGELRAVALADLMPSNLAGAARSLPIPVLDDFVLAGNPATRRARARLIEGLYGTAPQPLSGAAVSSFGTIDQLEAVDFAGYLPSGGATYPDTPFGNQLKETAALIKADLGVEAISIDYGGWDHHNQQGPRDGLMASMLQNVALSLEAFYLDLQAHLDRLTVVAMSEFGRRVAENGSLGADHGHGNLMLLMGGHINGGHVFGTWPGLHPDQLDQGDLAITTDYRDVVSELLTQRLGTTDLATVLPGYTPPPVPLGVTV